MQRSKENFKVKNLIGNIFSVQFYFVWIMVLSFFFNKFYLQASLRSHIQEPFENVCITCKFRIDPKFNLDQRPLYFLS